MKELIKSINYNCKQVLSIFLLMNLFEIPLALSQGKPFVKSVRQLSEDSLELEWTFGELQENFNELSLKRYRIFYRNEEDYLFEWPGQMVKTTEQLNGPPYYTYNSTSTFDCYNQCIKNPTCDFAYFKNEKDSLYLNCFLFNGLNEKENKKAATSLRFDAEKIGEVMKISDYNDRIVLKNVPANKDFIFQVAVHGDDLNSWSHISDDSQLFRMNIEIRLSFETNDDGSIALSWRQVGQFQRYIISRYIITVKSDREFNSYMPKNNVLSKYTLEPDYYELDSSSYKGKVSNENECYQMCLMKSTCIRYAYFKDFRCYLMSNLNLTRSFYKNANANVYSIKSDTNSLKLTKFQSNTNYTVQLNFITPFGDVGHSNKIIYTAGKVNTDNQNELDYYEIKSEEGTESNIQIENTNTNEKDSNDKENDTKENQNKPVEESNDKDVIINQNQNNNAEIDQNEKEIDKNQVKTTQKIVTIKTEYNDDDYAYYYENDQPDSYDAYFDQQDTDIKKNKIRRLKTTTKTTTTLETTVKNIIIPDPIIEIPSPIKEDIQNNIKDENKDENDEDIQNIIKDENGDEDDDAYKDQNNDENEEVINNENFYVKDSDKVLEVENILNKKVGDRFQLDCAYNGKNRNNQIKWTKLNSESEQLPILSFRDDSETFLRLNFESLQKKDSGSYKCTLNNDLNHKIVNLFVTDIPSQPEIVNATVIKGVLWIKWNIIDNGGSNIENVILEWSEDFNNKSLPVAQKSFNWAQKKFDTNNQMFLNDTQVALNSSIRIKVKNRNGNSKESQTFLLKCLNDCGPDKLIKEEIKDNSLNAPRSQPENTYMTKKTAIVILILAIILITLILIYVVYDCRKKVKKSKEKDKKSSNENEEQDEKLIK